MGMGNRAIELGEVSTGNRTPQDDRGHEIGKLGNRTPQDA